MQWFFNFLIAVIVCTGQLYAQVQVGSTIELVQAVSNAKPGDRITLKAGRYAGQRIILKATAEKGKPIVIEASSKSKVLIESPVLVQGDYIHLSGLQFSEEGFVEIQGKGCRVSHSLWDDSKAKMWLRVRPGSAEIEIDHNTFQNKIYSNTTFEKGCPLLRIDVRNENERHHIHHNLFKDVAEGKVSNGYETVQIITENNPFDPPGDHSNSIIEDNLFMRCNGESEVISMKSNGNLLRRNTFRACKGGLVLRHGDDNIVTQNYFFGDGEKGSSGVTIQGSGQVVANNYFEDLGSYGLGMRDGTPDDLYVRVERAQIVFNTFINCNNPFNIGLNHSLHPNGTAPKDCQIIGNIFYSDVGDKTEDFIEFVQNDQPVNWIWKDNVGYGKVTPSIKGFRITDPYLERGSDDLMLPTKKTPVSKFGTESGNWSETDLFERLRDKKKTIGAIQFPVKADVNLSLSESDFK